LSVTAAKGFRASGIVAGLKQSGAPDVALVVNDGPHQAAAAVFTSNRIKAAPVLWSQQCLTTGELHAVALNSGGANACTGPGGFADTHHTAEHVAELLDCGPIEVAVCSTGLIGERLDMGRLLPGFSTAAAELTNTGGEAAAVAIMTTDTVAKTATAQAEGVIVGGMAKGAGMLAPGMATMLSVLTTDAVAQPEVLQQVLTTAVARSFNRVDSDGCMSTNDTVVLMASGASGTTPSAESLAGLVEDVAGSLSRQLIADAEGASKEITIEVRGATDETDAEEAARAVARSNLFKCAVHGEDPNWGRILSAVGTTTAQFEPDAIDVAVNGVWVCRDGSVGADRELVDMSGRDVQVTIDLRVGSATATIWTNDLTADYVHENSAYST
jgi:glutamate N-acetyltransferase/amino-acid N-acetyltransferase